MVPRPFNSRALPVEVGSGDAMEQVCSRSAGVGREIAALLIFAAATFLFLALCSFARSPSDPSVEGLNWVGPVGATVAGWFVQGFGVIAWLLPVELGLLGYPLFRGRAVGALGLRIAGDLIVGIVAASLTEVMWPDSTAFVGMVASGNVGLLFGELMRGMFSTLGSLLVGSTLIGLVLLGRSAFSFIELCDVIGSSLLRLVGCIRCLLQRVSSAWFEARRIRQSGLPTAAAVESASEPPSEPSAVGSVADGDNEWIPFEQTGSPPMAILDALRAGPTLSVESLLESETPLSPPGVLNGAAPESEPRIVERSAELPTSAPSVGAGRRERKKSKPASVDTGESDAPPIRAARKKPAASRSHSRARGETDEREDELECEVDDSEEDIEHDDELGADSGEDDEVEQGATATDESEDEPAPPTTLDQGTTPNKSGQALIVERPLDAGVPTGRANLARRGRGYRLPVTDLLAPATGNEPKIDRDKVLAHATRLEKTLLDYGVVGKVEEIHPGPTVTTFELAPQAGTKVSKVAGLADDLALGLSRKVRIIAPIPGKSRIGFELPNDQRIPVNLRELVEDARFAALSEKAALPVVLGRDIVGAPFYADLASMPHVIVAGATGAGKSVGLNVMLASLLFRRTPDELRLLMVDPKVVELAPFDRIPHLLLPVVTDMKQANQALKWAVDEMERRYQLFATAGTKNIGTYNRWVERVTSGELPPPPQSTVEALTGDGAVITVRASDDGADGVSLPGKLPYIVIVIDEFADLMMQQGKEVESSVARLAQKARAAGLHVVLATQRPSVDVITGMIKANFPSRIAYLVAQRVDSRTILDEQGAEMLLGRGDMLVKLNGGNNLHRVQCPFISEDEVSNLTDYIRTQGQPQYHDVILQHSDEEDDDAEAEALDARFEEAVRIVAETQRCSTSWLQRKMTIGYNRAAKIVETMERRGMVGPPNGAKDREVLILSH
jgi:DNA segregation ATPase FtsK/SpoIIIE, S-DNA-T family